MDTQMSLSKLGFTRSTINAWATSVPGRGGELDDPPEEVAVANEVAVRRLEERLFAAAFTQDVIAAAVLLKRHSFSPAFKLELIRYLV